MWRRRDEAFTLSADDLCAILWHQHKMRSFKKIARLTRHQIANILCREVDKEGRVELKGIPRRRQKKEAEQRPQLSDYRSIFHYCREQQLQAQGLTPERAKEEAAKQWWKTPVGKAEAQAKAQGGM